MGGLGHVPEGVARPGGAGLGARARGPHVREIELHPLPALATRPTVRQRHGKHVYDGEAPCSHEREADRVPSGHDNSDSGQAACDSLFFNTRGMA